MLSNVRGALKIIIILITFLYWCTVIENQGFWFKLVLFSLYMTLPMGKKIIFKYFEEFIHIK